MRKEQMSKEQIKKTRWLMSMQKECEWLEEMAAKGYFLTNITMGIHYTFEKGEPKRMCYDVDRFSLSAKPTLEEIRHKEMFLEMAEQMGWKEITHDESQNYYFAKEYVEGEINELHNDKESRVYRARKFGNFYREQTKSVLTWAFVIVVMDLIFHLIGILLKENPVKWFDWFTLFYVAGMLGFYFYGMRISNQLEKELSVTREEWKQMMDPKRNRTERKFILTMKGLNRYLNKKLQQGWLLTGVTPLSYTFVKTDAEPLIYTVDTKNMTNKRWKEKKHFSDSKDWLGVNADWQAQSVADAEEKGWKFVCALENRSIVYAGNPDKVEQLNDSKDEKGIRFVSMIGAYGVFLACCMLAGGVVGFLIAWMQDVR